jgi:hypothetical protein
MPRKRHAYHTREARRFHDNALDLLINYMKNAYPTTLAHFKSFDQILHRLLVDSSPSASHVPSDIAHPDLSELHVESIPENPRWSNTEDDMTAAREHLMRTFKHH